MIVATAAAAVVRVAPQVLQPDSFYDLLNPRGRLAKAPGDVVLSASPQQQQRVLKVFSCDKSEMLPRAQVSLAAGWFCDASKSTFQVQVLESNVVLDYGFCSLTKNPPEQFI